ncbi:MAG: hypothetical protein Tp172MES00d2C118482111_24 [Prokaryotic dsDNA virus sp.]|nr:MAG: hypothetical protein Tp172MES00d2C118482111_24 [Prokaryotic dsDNA virus sp.]|tara:strand:+ start:16857 stop:17756 length:900 start_codon:yes stop_codon:yes gene_type:complete
MSTKKSTTKSTAKEAPAKAETKSKIDPEALARLKEQSGVNAGGTRLPVVNRVALNGDADAVEVEGTDKMERPPINYRKMLMVDKDPDKRPETEDLGAPIEVVFVKVRRRLIARDSQGFQVMSSSQHGHPNHVVAIWSDNKLIDKGPAREMREKYEDLRTVQEVYALLPDGELVMVIIKGAALGSKTRDKKLPTFYEYLQQLDKEGGIFMRKTILGGALEKGAKTFYTPTFEMGRPSTDEELAMVIEKSDELTEVMEKYDEEQASVVVSDDDETGSDDELPFDENEEVEGGDAKDKDKAF